MSGATDLTLLLQHLLPERNPGEYVFCTVASFEQAAALQPVGLFHENAGVTVILPRAQANDLALPYPLVCAWITLTVRSSLEAVGLTAAVSGALARAEISCNVIAAYCHDHVFVPVDKAERAIQVLLALTIQ